MTKATRQPPHSTGSGFFSRIARQGWRKSDYFTYTSKYPALRKWLVSLLPTKRASVLSIGCGSGELEKEIAQANHWVVGLDMSHEMLRRAARRRGGGAWVRADARHLPFRSGCFDFVIFPESVGYFDLRQAFAEARRVLRARGRIVITTYPMHLPAHNSYKKLPPEKLASLLDDAGFRPEETRLLNLQRNAVTDAPAPSRPMLVYMLARAAPNRKKPSGL